MISLSVGLSTPYKYVSKATHPDFTKFSVHVTYLRPWLGPLVALQYTGFVDDIIFSHDTQTDSRGGNTGREAEFDVYDCHAFTLQKATQCTQKHISSFLYVLSKHSNDLVKLLQYVSLSAFLGLTVLYCTFLLICLSLCVCVWAMLPDSNKMMIDKEQQTKCYY